MSPPPSTRGRLAGLLDGLAAHTETAAVSSTITRGYAIDGGSASVLLRTADRSSVRLTEQLVRPAYPGHSVQSGWTVTIVPVEPRALAPLPYAAAGAAAVDAGPGSRLARLPGPDRTIFTADDHRTLIDADLHRGVVRVYTTLPQAAASWAPTLIRQAMTAQQRANGAVHAHAAAVRVAGTDILIAGVHGSGKTTAVLACLRRLGADLVADSRVLLSREPGGLVARPWPTPLTIASGSLLPYPELRMILGAPDPRAQSTGHTVTVGSGQSDVLLCGGSTRHTLRPRLVLWPQLDLGHCADTDPPPRSTPVDLDRARDTLLRGRLFLYDRGNGPRARIDDWLSDPLPPAQARPITPALREVVDDLLRLETHRIRITRDPAAIARQVLGLLPTVPLSPDETLHPPFRRSPP